MSSPEANVSKGRDKLLEYKVQDVTDPEVLGVGTDSRIPAPDQLPHMQLLLGKARPCWVPWQSEVLLVSSSFEHAMCNSI